MKKKISLLFLTASFVFALAIPIQPPSNTKVTTNWAQHGG